MDLYNAALTLAPLLMVIVAVLFGQLAAQERADIARGKRIRFFLWSISGAWHKRTVRIAATFAAAAPLVAMIGSIIGLATGWKNDGLTCAVAVALSLQVVATGAAIIVRVTDGLEFGTTLAPQPAPMNGLEPVDQPSDNGTRS